MNKTIESYSKESLIKYMKRQFIINFDTLDDLKIECKLEKLQNKINKLMSEFKQANNNKDYNLSIKLSNQLQKLNDEYIKLLERNV